MAHNGDTVSRLAIYEKNILAQNHLGICYEHCPPLIFHMCLEEEVFSIKGLLLSLPSWLVRSAVHFLQPVFYDFESFVSLLV